MTDNNNQQDAFDMMFAYMDKNPDADIDEVGLYLFENGFVKSEDSLRNFFAAMTKE